MKPLIVCFKKLSLPSPKKSMSITPSTLHQNGITVREGGGLKTKPKETCATYSQTELALLLFFLELQYSLGLSLLNSNVSSEMAQLLATNQDKYVPHERNANGDLLFTVPIFFDGDALTEERARNVQWAFIDGDDDIDCLRGLDRNHTDWHAKVTLYEVSLYYLLI